VARNLQEEIRQSKPFHSAAEEAFLSILRTADHLRRQATLVVEKWDITEQQYNVLRILRGAGESGLPVLEIASRMIEQTPGITRLLDRLEAKKLIRRDRCKEDRRQVICRIAPQGLQILKELDVPTLKATADSLSALSREELRNLIAMLERIRAG
jgi:DNA-binding MarR family transcriptional regulator